MDDDDYEMLKEIADSLGQAQARNRANSYILMEVVRDLAKMAKDSDEYLANMFERISARADQGEIESEAHPVTAEFREVIATFFAVARNSLKRRG
jgi:hypothetical protein